jgi:hypothetical protein
MSTSLQLLRLAFWLFPFQRLLTCLGLGLIALNAVTPLPFGAPGSTLPAMFLGAMLVFMTPVALGGILWRAMSSPRAVQLAPRGRSKLLLGAAVVALAGALLWTLCYALAFVHAPAKVRPDTLTYVRNFIGAGLLAMQFGISLFVASRSPLAALCVVAYVFVPESLLRALGHDDASWFWTSPKGLLLQATSWAVFAVWYLRSRRIHPAGWLMAGGQTPWATRALDSLPPHSQAASRQATDRWLLGCTSLWRLAGQWMLAAAVMLLVQVGIARLGADKAPLAVVRMLLATLSISIAIVAMVSFAATRRSRSLWLIAGLGRAALFRRCEGLLLRVLLAVGLAFGVLFALLWATLVQPVPWSPVYLALSLLGLMMAAGWLGLAHVRGGQWIDGLAALAIVAALYQAVLMPLFSPTSEPPWRLLVLEAAGIAALRALAWWRWRTVEWRSRP